MTIEPNTLRDEIRRRYAQAATVAAGGQQATDGPADACFGTALYDNLDGIPGRLDRRDHLQLRHQPVH